MLVFLPIFQACKEAENLHRAEVESLQSTIDELRKEITVSRFYWHYPKRVCVWDFFALYFAFELDYCCITWNIRYRSALLFGHSMTYSTLCGLRRLMLFRNVVDLLLYRLFVCLPCHFRFETCFLFMLLMFSFLMYFSFIFCFENKPTLFPGRML